MKYIPALDGVRALAILLVLVYHWFPEGQGINVMPQWSDRGNAIFCVEWLFNFQYFDGAADFRNVCSVV